MNVDEMYQKLADSELAKTLMADDKQHVESDDEFKPHSKAPELSNKCYCIRCKTIRALKYFVDKHDDGKRLKPGMSIFTPPQFIGVKGEG